MSRSTSTRSACARPPPPATRWCSPTACGAKRWWPPGISRAAAVVVTFADAAAAVRVLSHIHALNPTVPVVVRARDEADIERLTAAGASEVVPEAFESGVMLASHTLVLVGVPLAA